VLIKTGSRGTYSSFIHAAPLSAVTVYTAGDGRLTDKEEKFAYDAGCGNCVEPSGEN